MSNTVEKNFSGFVKMVIGATGLVAMGGIVAAGSLLKGFREGAKTVREAGKNVSAVEAPAGEKKPESDSSNTQ